MTDADNDLVPLGKLIDEREARYGKPTGWRCPVCGFSLDAKDPIASVFCAGPLMCSGDSDNFDDEHVKVALIPVFAPVPAGQRPEAEEPDDDTVWVATGAGLVATVPRRLVGIGTNEGNPIVSARLPAATPVEHDVDSAWFLTFRERP